MVLQYADIALVTFHMHQLESRVLSQCVLTVAHTVTLGISLGRDIETILVAEVVPARVVGIVTGAHGIDIELFHDADILNHPFD